MNAAPEKSIISGESAFDVEARLAEVANAITLVDEAQEA